MGSTSQITILFVASDPSDTSRLRLGEEFREIKEKLQLAKLRDQFLLEARTSVRPKDIAQAIFDTAPTIVHFAGHGTKGGKLCFENDSTEVQTINPDAIASLFELVAQQVRCVILNACYSGIQADSIAQYIDYVIGMKQEIGDQAAITFAVGFYRALGSGRSIEDAYKFGVVELKLQGISEHLTPVLIKKNSALSNNSTTHSIGVKAIEEVDQLAFFDAPRFADQVLRTNLLSRLLRLAKSNPVVAIEGLAGSGKTYLASSFLEKYTKARSFDHVIWYDTQCDETMDDFLAHIEVKKNFTGLSIVSKCKELLSYLRNQNVLLVIDDFHQVEQTSFSTLINIASGYGKPASVILISRTYVDLIRNSPKIGHLEIRGFNIDETRQLLAIRGLRKIYNQTLEKLRIKTDGLPLAASLFVTLVKDFGRDPNDLLSGNILSSTRLRSWFNDVCSLVGNSETRLLKMLSACDRPFNIGIVRMACRYLSIAASDDIFGNLQRSYLVQTYTPYRWKIHKLISMFCFSQLNVTEKQKMHLEFARYYMRGFQIGKSGILHEQEFIWKIRACQHFQYAKKFDESAGILRDVAKTAKARGHCELFIQLSKIDLKENQNRNDWLIYDFAHCFFITGKLKESLEVVEPLLNNTSKNEDMNKWLAIVRLYVEILGSMGKYQIALNKLREATQNVDLSTVQRNILAHLSSIEVWLLTKLGEYQQAVKLSEFLLAEHVRFNNKLGAAVELTRLGIICQLNGLHKLAFDKLSHAVDLFKEINDRRAFAWSLSHLAISQLALGDCSRAINSLNEALQIKLDSGDCSVDYFEFLNNTKEEFANTEVLQLINSEIQRVSEILSNQFTLLNGTIIRDSMKEISNV